MLLFQSFESSFCCEPTYKELKQIATTHNNTTPHRCEPTYKELKLIPVEQIFSIFSLLRAYL